MGVKELLAYAYHGLGPPNYQGLFDETVKHQEYVRRLIEAAKSAVATVGPEHAATRSLSAVLLAAEGRLALDQGHNVTPEQLASLARIGIKSMRNALAPSSGSGLKMHDGVIVAESALNWLHARGNYKTTIWLEEKSLIAPVAEPIAGEILFVPFASDDIEFHPVKCRRDGKYTVGQRAPSRLSSTIARRLIASRACNPLRTGSIRIPPTIGGRSPPPDFVRAPLRNSVFSLP